MVIQSSQNTLFKTIQSLKQKKYRDQENLFILEGEKCIQEIKAPWKMEYLVVNETREKDFPHENLIVFSNGLFDKLAPTRSTQGVLGIVRKQCWKLTDLKVAANSFFIYVENVQDPGNLGTMIRLGHSGKAAGILVSENACDIYNPKVIRASAGSIFSVPVVEGVETSSLKKFLQKKHIPLFTLALGKGKSLYDIDLGGSFCMAVGNEGTGLSEDILNISSQNMYIPMPGGTESLNASMAISIAIYESVRQRLRRKL